MDKFLVITVLGLALGSVYALAASGLVLTYTTSGIFNFAHGAQAMFGAYLFWQLVDWGLPSLIALLVCLFVFAPLLGAAIYMSIMRGLRNTAEVTRIVVTVALMLGLLYLAQWIWPLDPNAPPRDPVWFFGGARVSIGGVEMQYHRLFAVLCVGLIAAALRWFFVRTQMGVAMRGAVDDPDLLQLSGHNPERVAAFAWALGSMMAVLTGIVVAPIIGNLEHVGLAVLVIDAFAAAMFGRLRSIPLTFLGAMVLGLGSNYLLGYAGDNQWLSSVLRNSLPMIVLFIVLVALPQDRLRGTAVRTRERFRVPTVRSALIWSVVLVGVVFLLSGVFAEQGRQQLTIGLSLGIIALSVILLTGYAGEVNLAPMSFAAVGGLAAFQLADKFNKVSAETPVTALRNPIWILFAAALITSVIGGLVALPALRLRGLYLALATMAFGGFLSAMVLRDTSERHFLGMTFHPFPQQANLTVAPFTLFGLDLGDRQVFLIFVAVVFALLGIGLVALRNSGYGRRLTALKDSPAAAATLGQNVVRLKLSVFMLSSAIAGLGGVLFVQASGQTTSETYIIIASLALVMLTVVCGVGYVSGALFAGMITILGGSAGGQELSSLAQKYERAADLLASVNHMTLVATALLGVMIAHNPNGFVHDLVAGYQKLKNTKLVVGVVAGLVVVLALAAQGSTDEYGNMQPGLIKASTFCFLAVLVVFLGARVATLIPPALNHLPEGARAKIPRRFLPYRDPEAFVEPTYEWVGIDEPYSDEVRALIDNKLGLPVSPVRRLGATRVPDEPALPSAVIDLDQKTKELSAHGPA